MKITPLNAKLLCTLKRDTQGSTYAPIEQQSNEKLTSGSGKSSRVRGKCSQERIIVSTIQNGRIVSSDKDSKPIKIVTNSGLIWDYSMIFIIQDVSECYGSAHFWSI